MNHAVMNNDGSFLRLGSPDQEGTRALLTTFRPDRADTFETYEKAKLWADTANRYGRTKSWVVVEVQGREEAA